MHKHLFSKRLPKILFKKWSIAIDEFKLYYPKLNIDKLLIDLKGIHGFPLVSGNYLYKIEILNESKNIFKRKEKIETLSKSKLFNVCYPIDILSNKNSVCYKYQYFPNGDLLDYLTSNQLNYSQLDKILTQCLKILHRIHREGFFHYDVKLENIFIKDDKTVIYGDIECMRHISENIDGIKLGTAFYHPPGNINILYNHMDIFAFGKSIYKILSMQFINDLEKYGLIDQQLDTWFKTQKGSCLNLYKNISKLQNNETNPIIQKWLNIAYDCCILNEMKHKNNSYYKYFYLGDIYKKYD